MLQMTSLEVFKQIGKIADSDFLAMEVLPILWNFSLGPLLNLQQFQNFMALIKALSTRIEQEQTRKLQELSSSNGTTAARTEDFMSFGGPANGIGGDDEEGGFEALVLGRKASSPPAGGFDDWGTMSPPATARPATQRTKSHQNAPSFSWSTPAPSPAPQPSVLQPQPSSSRTITPDNNLSRFASLAPSTSNASSAFSQPLQPSQPNMNTMTPMQPSTTGSGFNQSSGGIDWSRAAPSMNSSNIWASSPQRPASNPSFGQPSTSSFSPPPTTSSPYSAFNIAPPPSQPASRQASFGPTGGGFGGAPQNSNSSFGAMGGQQMGQQKQGLDKYDSLL